MDERKRILTVLNILLQGGTIEEYPEGAKHPEIYALTQDHRWCIIRYQGKEREEVIVRFLTQYLQDFCQWALSLSEEQVFFAGADAALNGLDVD
jgi:hypothetical protein